MVPSIRVVHGSSAVSRTIGAGRLAKANPVTAYLFDKLCPDDKAGTEPFFPLMIVCREILRAAQFPIRAPMQRFKPQDLQQPSLPIKGLAIGARRGAPGQFQRLYRLAVRESYSYPLAAFSIRVE